MDEKGLPFVDELFSRAVVKMRDLAAMEDDRSNDVICAAGFIKMAVSMSVSEFNKENERNVTSSLSLVTHLCRTDVQARRETWQIVGPRGLIFFLRRKTEKNILKAALMLAITLTSDIEGDEEEGTQRFLREVKNDLVSSNVLHVLMDLVSISEEDGVSFKFPLDIVKLSIQVILLLGYECISQEAGSEELLLRLNRILWIIVDRYDDPEIKEISAALAEQIPFGRDAGTEEADELILMPILVKILSHGYSSMILSFMSSKAKGRKKSVIRRLCARRSLQELFLALGGLPPLVLISLYSEPSQKVNSPHPVACVPDPKQQAAEMLIAQVALSEKAREEVYSMQEFFIKTYGIDRLPTTA
ncbi:hypothetical protein GUITHDRAFT_115618 [Guillardia theta CCMP2712]|uniref:Uncharacterized protein n=1 Tax=Guillardia theta (strain CCMP2712) TaxID=905079 RepID=L1IQE8_GUITC|nr:hypothetical protein GUITHDRAFT_115618 [Guillardia theta CCMP2712]EKX38277.1 hypothetical protein GUITHDRAFT_115618 [Guillardia theta CCMP2712]|eukprot:XP_005825257.1 hypothetical protein GUITHDRAFT_115618 [Guillardia theta CCMP2712]